MDSSDEKLWAAVDGYIVDHLVPADDVLAATLAASDAAGLPQINVSANQGKLLGLIAQMAGARTVLEIGTLAGYSTIWLARALPAGGSVVSLEYSPAHAEVARANLARAGLADIVEVRVGPALESLPQLSAEGRGPFDLVFIDADKANNPQYFEWAMRLVKRGSVIVVDNVVRNGRVLDESTADGDIRGIRQLFEVLAADSRVSATALQTVGSKGYDGLAVVLVTKDL